jgi:hypothetical protein
MVLLPSAKGSMTGTKMPAHQGSGQVSRIERYLEPLLHAVP